VLEQEYSDHEARRDAGPSFPAVERRHLLIDLIPVDLAGQRYKRVLHVDDLIEPRSEQIA
jgi:hypothetical protein